jgi:hypothetical protein
MTRAACKPVVRRVGFATQPLLGTRYQASIAASPPPLKFVPSRPELSVLFMQSQLVPDLKDSMTLRIDTLCCGTLGVLDALCMLIPPDSSCDPEPWIRRLMQ